jgi:hypothetical protein
MYSVWTRHLKTDQEKQEFEKYVKGSKHLLERQMQILKEEEDNLDRSELDIKSFETPNYMEKQIFKNGYRSALQFMNKLIDLDQQK